MICESCGKEHDGTYGSGRFCSRSCSNRRKRTDEIKNKISNSLKGNVPVNKGIKKSLEETAYFKNLIRARNGDVLDITGGELEEYFKDHNLCEICGKTVEEVVRTDCKFKARRLCVDHDHKTKKFRGLLCQLCNRQLGWYEKYLNKIDDYLNKTK